MKIKRSLALFLCSILLFTGCSHESRQEVSKTFFAMDTVMNFSVYGDEKILDQTETIISDLESQMSVTDSSSQIAALNKNGSVTLTGDTRTLVQKALSLCERTDGALDLSIYPIVCVWGFTTGKYQVPDDNTISSLLPLVDYKQIQYEPESGEISLPNDMEIDLGSVAKGYAGQKVADYLKENGVTSGLLSLGGNIQAIGNKPDGSPWKIGIQDPRNNEEPMMVLINPLSHPEAMNAISKRMAKPIGISWTLKPDILRKMGSFLLPSLEMMACFATVCPHPCLLWGLKKLLISGESQMTLRPCL